MMVDEPRSSSPPSGQRRRSHGIVTPHRPRWFQRLGAFLLCSFEHALVRSLRFEWQYETDWFSGGEPRPVIFCAWHNRLALSMAIYRKGPLRLQPGRRLAALVSASRDGAFLAGVLERFGVQPVRGSSSRRGPQALLELTSWAERGYDLGITPDGPRGPRYHVQEGVVALAQLTGLPIIPTTYQATRKLCFRTWDRFQVPLPLATCRVVVAAPVWVPREASDDEREKLRVELEQRLQEMTRD